MEVKQGCQFSPTLSFIQGCKSCQYLCGVDFKFTLADIGQAAVQFWSGANDKKTIAFHGNMGVGKTTFIHALCDAKGVKDVVGSPTFSIINEYVFTEKGQIKKIFHIDLYRLKDEEEAIRAGVEDCLYSDYVCLVEWPENAPGLFPEDTLHVYIKVLDEKTRQISY